MGRVVKYGHKEKTVLTQRQKDRIAALKSKYCRVYDLPFIDELAVKLMEWLENKENYFLGCFAEDNYMHRSSFPGFAEKSSFFNKVFIQAKQRQETRLYQKGLSGRNVAMPIFALKNVAGWRDKSPEEASDEAAKVQISIANLIKDVNKECEDTRIKAQVNGIQSTVIQ